MARPLSRDRSGAEPGGAALQIPLGALVDDARDDVVRAEVGDRASVWAVVGDGGAGKTTALHAIATNLCALYPPHRVQLAIADFQNGIGRAGLASGHVAAYLGRGRAAAPQECRDWCAAVEHELDRRITGPVTGEFVVLIDPIDEWLDECPDMGRTVQRVVDEGQHLGVRIIMAWTASWVVWNADRGSFQRSSDTAHGRTLSAAESDTVLLLRTTTVQESRDVLGKDDAAMIPAERPGVGYLRSLTGVQGPLRVFKADVLGRAN